MLNESLFNRYPPSSRPTTLPLQYRNPSCSLISKPRYPYNTIITFLINYSHYNTIITLLYHLYHLQKSDHYNTLWQRPEKVNYYTYNMAIISIITFWIYYDTYVYYNTIISIMTFRTIMKLITISEPLWPIIRKGKHYVHYIHYNTIISIITFRTIITLITLRHYYTLLITKHYAH